MYEDKPEFLGGGGSKTKHLPWGEYGYFLEMHSTCMHASSLSKILINHVLAGEKQMVTWWRGYLVVVSQDNKQLQRPSAGSVTIAICNYYSPLFIHCL